MIREDEPKNSTTGAGRPFFRRMVGNDEPRIHIKVADKLDIGIGPHQSAKKLSLNALKRTNGTSSPMKAVQKCDWPLQMYAGRV